MSCNKTWKIDGASVMPHVLEYHEVRSYLKRLEDQAKEQRAALTPHLEGLAALLPDGLLEAVQEAIDAFRPFQREIDDVFVELSRREPARQQDELLRLFHNGRLGDRLRNNRVVDRAFAELESQQERPGALIPSYPRP